MGNDTFITISNGLLSYCPPSSCRGLFPQNILPQSNQPIQTNPIVLKANTYEFTARADGFKRIYTSEDGLSEYESSTILDPNNVTYYNLYVNGIFQPSSLYTVVKNYLIFDSTDVPGKDQMIVLQFVIFQS